MIHMLRQFGKKQKAVLDSIQDHDVECLLAHPSCDRQLIEDSLDASRLDGHSDRLRLSYHTLA